MLQIIGFFLLTSTAAQAQPSYPQNYFRHPLNIPMQLVANFGEIRSNHWHMGLDIRTQQRVNLPVFAAADGFISRVVVEPGGFGQAIYIDHPNGYTTLYAHLNAFFPALADYVKARQYEQESWAVNVILPSGLFTVKKGDQIGLSGSTGASEGPHVHFEIRDTRTEACLNPLLFGFPLPDAVPPTISRLALYDRNRSTYNQSPQLLSLQRSGNGYTVAGGAIRTGSDRISFAIGAVDRFSGSTNPNGIYSAKLLMDGRPVSAFVHDRISYADTRYINAQLDFPYKSRGGADLQHITPLPGARSVAYELFGGDGVVQLNDGEPHRIVIEVKDANGNLSTIAFNVQYDAALAKPYSGMMSDALQPNQVNIFERPDFELFTTELSIYDTVAADYRESAARPAGALSSLFSFLGRAIPSHDSVTVRLRVTANVPEGWADRIVIRNVWGARTFVRKAQWQRGWVAAKFRQFGTYQAFVDMEPPVVNAPPANLSRAVRIVFTPQDNFDVIKSFRAELDGRWLRFSNDKGRSWIYAFDEHFPAGTHELKVIVTDEAGNTTTKSWTVSR